MNYFFAHLNYFLDHLNQEIYIPGTAISDASNLCTAVGGDQNKEFKGNASEYIAIVGYAHHDL